jgi:hypothetical protein
MRIEKRNSVLQFTRVRAISIYRYTTVVCHYTFSYGAVLRRTPASSGASSLFGRATCLGFVALNCKHFYPTLHAPPSHLLPRSNFLKGARKTLRDDLRDAISSPLRSQLQARSSTWIFEPRIDFLLLDWDMQDFGELYGPLSSLDTPESWPHLMSRVVRFHDAVYMNHRSTF